MDIFHANTKIQKLFSQEKKLRAEFGPQLAKTISLRLAQLGDAGSLETLRQDIPGLRIHEYQGADKGKISINLTGNMRLIFKPTDPPPLKPDGGLNWHEITAIVILEVTDPH